ncbi:M1 family metallopeptidase [Mucilaginibacter sp. BJC16-A38]|uniref:M1 family metallopeptidase n=1 Tax=Mucilaginibacter phenanthrenivorans TaxID=1234842 RepID=UPI0021573FA1|nr:M1 family metallopeptidase [Mucilaginibacter phenanthrenivorans]MCR8556564.1 M1 family metallopeptidase [Mucilaginibacter phenanthrenivorans]
MKKLYTTLLGSLSITCAISQSAEAQLNLHPANVPYYHATAPKINDLVDTKLDVKFDYQHSHLIGKEWVTLKPHFYPTDSVRLDAKWMDIKTIGIMENGKVTPLKYEYQDSLTVAIQLDRTYKNNERYVLYIDYVAKPNDVHSKPGFKYDGKGLYFVNPLGTELDKPTQIWTQGEAESSSCWFPTIDKPDQKTTEQVSMTVPAKYTTLSNGLLISQKPNTDGTRTDTWKQSLPHCPYLFMMAVGDFKIYKDKWRNKEVNYYLEPAYFPYAKQIFGQTPAMMELFSKALGVDFAWEKYAQIVVRDYPLGAMENSSATLHGAYVQNSPWDLIDDPNGSGGTTIAHELFHQWFGDLVTCESWSNETLNESFAVFGEKYWNEKTYGKDDGDAKRYDELQAYLNNKTAYQQALTPFVYTDEEGVNGSNIYDKGGLVLTMLRNYLGDDAFFKGLGLYLKTHAFKNGEVQDLRLAEEEISGKDLNWFFNQWYYGAGHPVLDITYQWSDADHKEKVFISQKQDGQTFHVPIAVDLYAGGKTIRKQVWLSQKDDTLTFDLPAKPDLVNVDADKILITKKTDHKTLAEFAYQYQHAPLYLDRLEAINAAIAQETSEQGLSIVLSALKDKYHGLRIKAIRSLKMDSATVAKAALPILADLASHDANYPVRAAVIGVLGKTKSKEYVEIYKASLASPSYTVKGAALIALNSVDPDAAFKSAKSVETDGKGQLGQAIVTVYATSGSDKEWLYVIDAYGKSSVQQKFNLTQGPLTQMICRLDNKTYVLQGITSIKDLAISFKRFNIAPKLIAALQQIEDARKKLNDSESAGAAAAAIDQINKEKS